MIHGSLIKTQLQYRIICANHKKVSTFILKRFCFSGVEYFDSLELATRTCTEKNEFSKFEQNLKKR